MRLGFIGTGTITKAVVTGLLNCGFEFDQIALSPRNAKTAAELAALDRRIRVCTSNQDVLNASDVVCLAVVPQIATEVLGQLAFEARHHVISFMAGIPLAELHRLMPRVETIVRAVPLPPVAEGKGSTPICPADPTAARLFAVLGGVVEVSDESQFDALSAVTATMASFYAVLESQAAWLVKQGVDYEAARAYLSGFCVALAHDTTRTQQPFSTMVEHAMTPGGINEQVHAELTRKGTYTHFGEALDGVFRRITRR
jgi:pyrroline-5-carboxylate reductase